MGTPRVSVVIAAYDGELHLGAALASVRAQTLADHEVVVVDAGSSDATADLVRAAAQADPRVRLLPAEGRLDAPQARNRGRAAARAPYVATLDQDDLMRPRRLELQVAALDADPSLLAVGGGLRGVDAAGVPFPPRDASPPWSPATLSWLLPFTSPAVSSSLVHRAEALEAVGGFDEAHPLCDDYALLVRLDAAGPVGMVREVVGGYRRHGAQTSALRLAHQRAEVVLLRLALVVARLGERPPPDVVRDLDAREGGQVARPEEAVALCGRLHAAFVASRPLDDDERAWVDADLARRVAMIRAAELVTAEDAG